ncbi:MULTISPECIES: hypothetical protein [unclassified Nocardia]|uniref:hypothetical protein n=1 Tax=unclassified Nocardia TaxID=2637762 RepID=UPI001CE45F43|nr:MULTISPECIES: hypothetical protein [unclassified Nocardia]
MTNTGNDDRDPLWQQAQAAVTAHAERLRGFTEHGHLYGWAVVNGLGGPELWPRVKHELREQLGIDFDQLRAATHAARRAAIAHADKGPHLRLWAAGDNARQSFAVCGPRGVLWYNNLTLDDWWYRGDQATAELSAAHRAIWIAGRARTLARVGAARLTLHLTAPGIHTDLLAGTTERARLALVVEPVAADSNPAIEWCRKPGRRACTDLPEFIDTAEEPSDATTSTRQCETAKPAKNASRSAAGVSRPRSAADAKDGAR